MKAYPALPADANVQAWLVRIAHRKAIDVTRAAARRAIPVAETPDTTAAAAADSRDLDLTNALSTLPAKQKQAVAYHHLAGLPYAEVAAGPRRQHRCRPTRRGRRHRHLATLLSLRRRTESWTPMSTYDLTSALMNAYAASPEHLRRLHDRLATAAQGEGVLDVAYRTLDTPLGGLLLAGTERGLVKVAYAVQDHEQVLEELAATISPRVLLAPSRLDAAAREVEEYLAGLRRTFDLPLDLRLARGFRRDVLTHLQDIGFGQTASYAALAAAAGSPKAFRAAGSACATNPLPIVVPCHRAILSNGRLGQYVGGLDAKRTLLTLEQTA